MAEQPVMKISLHNTDELSTDKSILLILQQLASIIPVSRYLLVFLLILFTFFLYNSLEFHILHDLIRGFRGGYVRLTFHKDSHIYHRVASKCRTLQGTYLATLWLSSPHFQTTFLNFFGNPPVFRYRRQIFRFRDGGTVALDWLLPSDVTGRPFKTSQVISKDDTTPIVLVVPGLTSDSSSPYMKHLVYKVAKQGWNVVVSNHRGLGGMSITSDCFYNAGWTEDIRVVLKHLHREYPNAPLFAVGTSLGGNILVKYLGEEGRNTPIAGAACVCSPWDLLVCDRFINRKLVQKLYDRALVIGLKGYAKLHQHVLARMANWEGIKQSRSIRDFDNFATCLVANYETVDTFYRRCSSVSYLSNVSVPLLCISSLDDPLCTKEAIPWDECRANKNVVMASTTRGGHLAFFKGIAGKSLWWVEAVEEFFSVLHSTPFMHKQQNAHTADVHSLTESAVDKAPFVSVTEDGMLETIVDDVVDMGNPETLCTSQEIDAHRSGSAAVESSNLQNKHHEDDEAADEKHSASLGMREPSKHIIMTADKMIVSVKESLNHLRRQKLISIWLIAYITIITTWPLVGGTLNIVFRRKKNALLTAFLRQISASN